MDALDNVDWTVGQLKSSCRSFAWIGWEGRPHLVTIYRRYKAAGGDAFDEGDHRGGGAGEARVAGGAPRRARRPQRPGQGHAGAKHATLLRAPHARRAAALR
eukprot:4313530-Pleurochrysis_carterae.AAC.1